MFEIEKPILEIGDKSQTTGELQNVNFCL